MCPAIASDICRVTVIGPRRRVDIALPAQVQFADLFPTVARFSGLDHSDLVREPGGWVLQRLGYPPFDLSATPASEGLLDGELIYLRPKATEMPPMMSDDIADEIAGVHDGPGRWTPADARRAGIGAGALALLAGVAVIARSGPPWTVPAVVAGAVAALLLVVAGLVSRAAGDATTGILIGYASLPYAFLAGLAGVTAATAGTAGRHPGGAEIAGRALVAGGALGTGAGFALVMLAAVVAMAGVARGLPHFFGVAVAALFGVGAAGLAYADPSLHAAGAAALVVTPALALTPLIPWGAFRIAGLAMPRVPASPEDLSDDAVLTPQPDVRPRAVAADRAVTGAVCGLGLVGGGAEIVLGSSHGVLAIAMASALACALLLQSRVFRGRTQRLWLLVPGYGALAWLAIASGRLVIVAALVAGGGLVVGVGSWLQGHRPSPFWGRAADIVDMLLIISLIPLALGVAGVLGYLHGLGG
ncbi:MAG TPA: type VII secretion integral membrane protein EccD [Trebonia sp.]